MDLETAEFYTRVRVAYLGIAARERERFKIVDANGSVDEIHRTVAEIVNGFLG
jgi:dTMP kinase